MKNILDVINHGPIYNSDLESGYAVLSDDTEINFIYNNRTEKFEMIDDERYSEEIKDDIQRQHERKQGREPDYNSEGRRLELILEALKLK